MVNFLLFFLSDDETFLAFFLFNLFCWFFSIPFFVVEVYSEQFHSLLAFLCIFFVIWCGPFIVASSFLILLVVLWALACPGCPTGFVHLVWAVWVVLLVFTALGIQLLEWHKDIVIQTTNSFLFGSRYRRRRRRSSMCAPVCPKCPRGRTSKKFMYIRLTNIVTTNIC